MKKAIYAALVVVLTMASCGETKDPVLRNTSTYTTWNLYSPIDGDGESFVMKVDYSVSLEYMAQTISIGSSLNFNGANHELSTVEGNCEMKYFDNGGEMLSFSKITGFVGPEKMYPVEISGMITNLTYTDTPSEIGEIPGIGVLAEAWRKPVVAMGYNIGNLYSVHTFSCDSFYGGVTNTTAGQMGSFSSAEVIYRVAIDAAKAKADVMIYNAQFNEKMPKLQMALRGLNVEWGKDAYVVKGTDIVPEVLEAGAFTPNESFIVNSFELATTGDDLTNAQIDYVVKGMFHGSCTSSTVKLRLSE